ncbi:hypothetical protein BMW23_0816 [Bodo saltans virus]|jgi:hypothetical protein|uniref:Uncharacterized protein n=1 Tax=Bodo saltans virus TaxID=2024608 RepID=A0A2H4UVB4_9VIRU|nr:hypothetical protein QJ851_gp0799 [Bodo saltans virus]ATZ80862.1 hypothetical protein BMW23_0816 [Bodo saltans virus]
MEYLIIVPLLEPFCKITSSAQGIYSISSNISSYYSSYPDMVTSLKRLDIEASIRIIDNLINELDIDAQTKTLGESMSLLKECIMNIEKELISIYDKMAYNKSIYFRFARGYGFGESIKNLETLKRQLDNRTKMFFLILDNNKKLTKKQIPISASSMNVDMSILDRRF